MHSHDGRWWELIQQGVPARSARVPDPRIPVPEPRVPEQRRIPTRARRQARPRHRRWTLPGRSTLTYHSVSHGIFVTWYLVDHLLTKRYIHFYTKANSHSLIRSWHDIFYTSPVRYRPQIKQSPCHLVSQ